MAEGAYKKFLSFVTEFANPYRSRNSWQEVIGFMFGRFSSSENPDYEVYVTDVLPMDSGSAVYVKIGDYSPVFPVIQEKATQNEFIVGWIHSHPGLGIFLSGTDVNTQSMYQNMDQRSVAIVVDQTKINKTFSGMKCFRVDKKGGSYDEIPLEIENITDYPSVYERILDDLVPDLKILSPAFTNEKMVSIADIKINLKAPSQWSLQENSLIPVYLFYECKDEGFVSIVYKITVSGGSLFNNNRNYKKHLVYNSSILAYFQIEGEKSRNNIETIKIRIEDLEIANSKKEKIQVDPLELEIKNKG